MMPSDPTAQSTTSPAVSLRAGVNGMRRTLRYGLVALAAASLLVGAGIAFHIGWFYWRSHTVGRNLIQQETRLLQRRPPAPVRVAAAGAGAVPPTACTPQYPSPGQSMAPGGLLEIPALGLQAPVVQGANDAELNVAVGHIPASSWPASSGTVVLSAHDVTWFSRIGSIVPGALVQYKTACGTWTYRVTSHAIVHEGSPIYQSTTGRLVLTTCYPLDALFLTPLRYLVYANLVSGPPVASAHAPVVSSGTGLDTALATAVDPTTTAGDLPLSAPAPLLAEGLSLNANPTPLGKLHLLGSPSAAWRQSPAPLQAAASAEALYFATLRTAAQGQALWWSQMAPGVPITALGPLWGTHVLQTLGALSPTLQTTPRGVVTIAQVQATVDLGGHGGAWTIQLGEQVIAGRLQITSAAVVPAP